MEQEFEESKSTDDKDSQSFSDIFLLKEPNIHAAISRDPETKGNKYVLIEPTLLEEEKEALKRIREILYEVLDVNVNELKSRDEASEYLKNAIKRIVAAYKIKLGSEVIDKIQYYLTRDLIFFGKIDALMYDHMTEDISCDGPDIPLYIWHRKYESMPTNIIFKEDELDAFVVRLAYLAGKHISIASPMLDASLPDGSRIQLTYGREVTRKGSTFTIRRFRSDPLTVSDLIDFNTLDPHIAAYFWLAIERKANIIIGGGTASGKTTTLNSLSAFIPPDNKIITIEDTAELNLPHENWISSVARIGFGSVGGAAEINLFDLLKAAMRQRPDYVIVGEVRGGEAYTLFQAMATGHGGLSSIHADSPTAALNRLESEPMNIPRTLLPTLNVVAMTRKVNIKDLLVRKVSHIVEIVGIDPVSKEVLTNEVFKWNPYDDSFEYSGKSIVLEQIMEINGIDKKHFDDEVENRKLILNWMEKSKIRRYNEVGAVIREYYTDPERLVNKAKLGLSS
ncbi:MAG: type II/IV secretion system ATPase subunit [Methanocellales archaeon]|nr:type II/IV secretion system ATPase subunit [Methanocellales archaeon]